MKKIKVTRTEATILDAIKEVKNKGIKIESGGWFVEWNNDKERWEPEANSKGHCSCPLGAYLLVAQPEPTYEQILALEDGADTDLYCEIAGTALGKDQAWAENFISNFDTAPDDNYSYIKQGKGARSGRKFRKLFVK